MEKLTATSLRHEEGQGYEVAHHQEDGDGASSFIQGVKFPTRMLRILPAPVAASALLTACDDEEESPPAPGIIPENPLTAVQASRLLAQATFGPTPQTLLELKGKTARSWLDEQFGLAPNDTHLAYVQRRGPVGCATCDAAHINAVMDSFWYQAITGPDQLRQRLVFALTEIFVISAVNSAIEIQAEAHASYLDMLGRLCFGNFRELIEGVALHPSMGKYLSHHSNIKEDPETGRIPDENFAREIMQLFTIGLWELNEDGSRKTGSDGNPIPTYGQDEIGGMARVFTGWGWGGPDAEEYRWNGWIPEMPWELQMQSYAAFASTSEKRILGGVVIPEGTGAADSLAIALDTLFNHPNVGPFIGEQLIKRLVTSNPSRDYVARVARAFNANEAGVRGDMRSVLSAILLDSEARSSHALDNPSWGKLREPIIRFANWMRAFDAKAENGLYQIWNLEDSVSSLGQNPMRAPSVFNWFRPSYAPPGPVRDAGLVAPEFQITHETTATGYANFMEFVVPNGFDGISSNYMVELRLVSNPDLLIDWLDLILVGGRLSDPTKSVIRSALTSFGGDDDINKVKAAVGLVMLSPDYVVQK